MISGPNGHLAGAAFAALALPLAPAQEEVWRVWSVVDLYLQPWPYGDFNGDGTADLIVVVVKNFFLGSSQEVVRVLSGLDGSVLLERPAGIAQGVVSLGDVDGDGHSEYALDTTWGSAAPNWLEIISPFQATSLWTVTGPFYGHFGRVTIGLNLDNDSNNEVVTSTNTSTDSRIFAYDHDGTLLYTINLLQPNNAWLRGLGSVGDIDADGADDFGVGLVEATTRGAVQLYSGRTGTPIRRDYGTQLLDGIATQIMGIGDMNFDGVPDYAASNRFGARGVIVTFSGANGAVLREWTGEQGLAEKLLAGPDFDLDLDGVPDVFAGAPRYWNGTGWQGRIQALSGRDGEVLWDMRNSPTSAGPGELPHPDPALGEGLANIGPLPGSPYPVVVVWDWPYKIIAPGPVALHTPRLRALRVGLAGTAVQGTGCTSTGATPKIGVRRDHGGLRVTLSGARPSALAWLLVGPRGATTWQGHVLPYQLNGWSLPGCNLLVPPDTIFSRSTGANGWDSGYALVTAPFTVATTGLGVAAQWFCFDPSSLDFAMSPRHELWIQ